MIWYENCILNINTYKYVRIEEINLLLINLWKYLRKYLANEHFSDESDIINADVLTFWYRWFSMGRTLRAGRKRERTRFNLKEHFYELRGFAARSERSFDAGWWSCETVDTSGVFSSEVSFDMTRSLITICDNDLWYIQLL